jgi:beta-lactamase regulating signal transducer with metallopeptidase domain
MIVLNILNSLVPTAAIALIAWVSLRLLRANAATRYGVWWVVLASVIAMVLRPQSTSITAPTAAPVELPPATSAAQDSLATWIVLAFVVWVGYVFYRAARIVVGYVWLRRIVRDAMPWSRPGVVLSDDVEGPITAGFLHPVIVLPTSFPDKLTAEELEHVLLHEQAHIARRDQWANLLARIVGVFFGLHPVAAFALHRIERERERACDDWVVAATGDARPYAASLTRVFELTRRGSQPDLASGFMGSRLGGRIEELLTQGRRFTRSTSIAVLAAIVVPIVILSLRAPATVAYAQAPETIHLPDPAGEERLAREIAKIDREWKALGDLERQRQELRKQRQQIEAQLLEMEHALQQMREKLKQVEMWRWQGEN